MKYDEVISRFLDRAVKRNGNDDWETSRHGSTFTRDHNRVIYNYDVDWPLAVRVGKNKKGEELFVKNGDRHPSRGGWGPSTREIITDVQRRCPGPTVSARALRMAGIELDRLKIAGYSGEPKADVAPGTIVDFAPDTEVFSLYRVKDEHGKFTYWHDRVRYKMRDQIFDLYWDAHNTARDINNQNPEAPRITVENVNDWEPWTAPRHGMFMPSNGPYVDCPEVPVPGGEHGRWHTLGAALIEQGNYYLCSRDEGTYFVAQLRHPCRTVSAAFDQLKPGPVRRAEKEGVKVLRQGEWFFVHAADDDIALAAQLGLTMTALRRLARKQAFPQQENRTNRHIARSFRRGKTLYASGTVRHYNRWGNITREHQPLTLVPAWYRAYENTEVVSWSMTGLSAGFD